MLKRIQIWWLDTEARGGHYAPSVIERRLMDAACIGATIYFAVALYNAAPM